MSETLRLSENILACPFCASPSIALFEKTPYQSVILLNRVCRKCGLVFLSPRMSTQDTQEYYKLNYRSSHCGSDLPTREVLSDQEKRAHHLISLIALWNSRKIARLLDIGASSGLLMAKAKSSFDCEVVGVEPGEGYRKYAMDHGAKIFESLEALKIAQEKRFDLIVISHVLEHLHDPLGLLADIRANLLEDTGRILIEVPNLYGHQCFEVGHLFSFNLSTLEAFVQKAGFTIEQSKLHSVPRRSDGGWKYITVFLMSNPQFVPSHIAKRKLFLAETIRIKRRVGLSGTRHLYGYLFGLAQRSISRLFRSILQSN